MSHIRLCFQVRKCDESQWLHTLDCKVLYGFITGKCKNGDLTEVDNVTIDKMGGEHRESNSGPLLPESRIIPLDHAPLTGGKCGEATTMDKLLISNVHDSILGSSYFDTSICAT